MAPHPKGPGLALVVTAIVLSILASITVALRIIARLKIKALGKDDWLMILGLLLFLLCSAFGVLATLNGIRAHLSQLTFEDILKCRKYFIVYQLAYGATTAPIKASICVNLLRITPERVYRITLWLVIGLSVISSIINEVAFLLSCQPVQALWDPFAGHCVGPGTFLAISYTTAISNIITDWACAILPALILWKIQMNLHVKASLVFVLGLGVIASTATLMRLVYIAKYGNSENTDNAVYGIANIATWGLLESGIGIIAGSLATLRPILAYIPFMRKLAPTNSNVKTPVITDHSHRLDVIRSTRKTGAMESARWSTAGPSHLHSKCGVESRAWEELSDGGSQRNILKNTSVAVEIESREDRIV
ncbi:hypothetical protein ACJQWK_04930 [Exserohilum turcicum]|uniref:Rhodopsin domain-containing protein n=1 Tax=Exserohilum turcicum (strain 28A) TaxID=671987 RepID=R0JZ85_EXST2|nr:uncharacterized protein SETTUDRAFT_141021 [Exserohilum turcica Et28A]EOA82779.1 hypothetical protein SETTUDRAFT_141021 [Exserohilum turcica Et28A]